MSKLACLAFMLAVATHAAASPAVRAAASRFVGGVDWQEQSVLKGDFNCSGKKQHAILGTSDKEIVVAVFTQDLARPPEVLRFAGDEHNPGAATIGLDDASMSKEAIQDLVGSVPPGYQPSASCKGLRLSDDTSGAAHIYWDHDAHRFDSWTE